MQSRARHKKWRGFDYFKQICRPAKGRSDEDRSKKAPELQVEGLGGRGKAAESGSDFSSEAGAGLKKRKRLSTKTKRVY